MYFFVRKDLGSLMLNKLLLKAMANVHKLLFGEHVWHNN